MPASSIPTTFKAFEYEEHSATPLAALKLNSSATHKPLGDTQVCVKVLSAALNPGDFKIVQYGASLLPDPTTKENPRRIGFDLAGVIVEIGSGDIKGFKIGDAVFAMAGLNSIGSFAEYINVDAKVIAPKPATLSFDEAASVPLADLTSYHALVTFGKLQAGQRLLILGGSSGTGTLGVQIAKALGAYVIATTSFRNTEFVASLGADEVIDYTKAKWSEVVAPGSIDLIYDCGFEPETWNDEAQKVLKPQIGIFVTLEPIEEPKQSPIGATVHHIFNSNPTTENLLEIAKFIDAKHVQPVIDSVYPFEKTLEAGERILSGRVCGKIVLHIAEE